MSLSSIKKMKSEKGFTIVELLIVIVVIGILAAIVIVAYNGVQNRANTTSRNSAAETLAKKIEAYNAVQSAYPTYNTTASAVSGVLNGVSDSSLAGSGIVLGTPTASTSNNTIQLKLCNVTGTTQTSGTTVPTGYAIYIWDTTLTVPGLNPVQAGGFVTISNGAAGVVNTLNPSSAVCGAVS